MWKVSSRRASRSHPSTLILYALPAFPLAALALPLFVIVPTFYSEVMGLPVAAVGGALFAIRLLDAASDPIFGWLADRWNGVGGRRRGFFLASIPLTAVAAFMLFWPPQTIGLGYLLIWGGLLSLGFTWSSLPYTAWGGRTFNRLCRANTRCSFPRRRDAYRDFIGHQPPLRFWDGWGK